ncbi:NUDIX hydrolase [Rhizobium rhizogenes]|uniref:NUDIX hydrolase n=1 Tax=Rhizobium rhizogenes TaxID=359 RepID=UPI001572A647|nr:NUDIX hydrolase [Rhizobium rhizogenes]NTF97907.1 NUDIX hydrolase [Rhizobium rhizogenes]
MPVDKKCAKPTPQSKLVEKEYAALCFRHVPGWEQPVQVLLITSRDTGRWVIPKGWGMAKKKPHEVARIEAWEEAGVRGKVRKKPCGYYTYAKRLGEGGSMLSIVQVHLLCVLELDEEFPEKGQRELHWFSPAAAATVVYEPDLRVLIANVRELATQFMSVKPDLW